MQEHPMTSDEASTGTNDSFMGAIFIFNRTERQIGSISDLQKNELNQRKFLRSKLDELKSTVLWLWSVDARVDEWRCINNQLYLSLSKETLNYSTKKLKYTKERKYTGGYYYWGKWWGVSEMWKMIVEMKTKQPCFVRENDSCWIVLIYHCTVHADQITSYTFLASSGRWPFPIYWMLHGSFRSAIVLTQPYLRRANLIQFERCSTIDISTFPCRNIKKQLPQWAPAGAGYINSSTSMLRWVFWYKPSSEE